MASHPRFKPVNKDSYFYSKYQYCITFTLDEVNVLKSLDHDYIDAVLERRKLWRETAIQRWKSANGGGNIHPRFPVITTTRWRTITAKTSENLHKLAEELITTTDEFKIVTTHYQCWVYTNAVSLIKKLKGLRYLTDKECTEAVVIRPKGTIKLKSPKHTHRSYVKSLKLTNQQKENLINFFSNNVDNIRVAPAFSKWLAETPYLRTQDYFFIDHTGESWLVMLGLVYPGLVRKTMEIIPG